MTWNRTDYYLPEYICHISPGYRLRVGQLSSGSWLWDLIEERRNLAVVSGTTDTEQEARTEAEAAYAQRARP